ncbi:MAG: hypothetical protein WBB65_15180 [Anaerolineales bacterium]
MNSKQFRFLVITPVILFSFFLTGCGPSTEEQAATSAALTDAAAKDFPTGEFYMPVIEDPRAPLIWGADGVYLTFNDDGTFTATDTRGIQRMSGTYRIDDNLYTETSTDMKSCQLVGPATYKWAFQDEFLTFIDVSNDECKIRKLLMDRRYLIKQE